MTTIQNVQFTPHVNPEKLLEKEGKKKKSTLAHAGAGFVAYTAAAPLSKVIKFPTHKLAMGAIDGWTKSNHVYKDAMLKAYADSGIAHKVQLVNAQDLKLGHIEELANKALPKWTRMLPKKLQDALFKNARTAILSIKDGRNAAFLPKAHSIVINTEKMAGASFHEMGHAMNKHIKGLGKVLHHMRRASVLAPLILLIAAFKPKKEDGEQPKNVVDRTTTFVKNNAGKLAFASMVPVLLEEGLASIKGAKLAKPHLSADAFKKLNIANAKAWLTYLAGAVAMGVVARVSSAIHDKIMDNREERQAKKVAQS